MKGRQALRCPHDGRAVAWVVTGKEGTFLESVNARVGDRARTRELLSKIGWKFRTLYVHAERRRILPEPPDWLARLKAQSGPHDPFPDWLTQEQAKSLWPGGESVRVACPRCHKLYSVEYPVSASGVLLSKA